MKREIEIREVDAEVKLEINVSCPFCAFTNDYSEDLKEFLGDDLQASNISKVLHCHHCFNKLEVNQILFEDE